MPDSPNAFLDAIPKDLRERVLEGRRERRGGKLPPQLVLQLVTAMAFRPDRSIPAVLEELVEVVGVPATWRGRAPEPSSITTARDRLGWETVRDLYRAHAKEIDVAFDEQRWRGLRVAGLDATAQRTPDSPENEAVFGRPGGKNPAGFPVLRCLALVDVFGHQVRAATFGPYKGAGTGEISLAKNYLLDQIPEETLILMDRGFCGYEWLRILLKHEVPFVVRLKTGRNTVTPKLREKLEKDNDALVDFPVPNSFRPQSTAEDLPLRLIKWKPPKQRTKAKTTRRKRKRKKAKRASKKLDTPRKRRSRRSSREVYLLTNLTDHQAYPWREIAQLYLTRWEVEFAFREIKATLTNRKVAFRSKRPCRVLQEAYAQLLAYNAIRLRMAQAVRGRGGGAPRTLSFTDCLHAVRRAYCTGETLERLLLKLARYEIPKRESRWYPRAVKSRSSSYPEKQTVIAA